MMMVALVNDVSVDVDGVGGKSIEAVNNNWAPEPMGNGVSSSLAFYLALWTRTLASGLRVA